VLHEGPNYQGYKTPSPLNAMYKHLESEVWGSLTIKAPHKAPESKRFLSKEPESQTKAADRINISISLVPNILNHSKAGTIYSPYLQGANVQISTPSKVHIPPYV
jgi:hypothetical protein